MFCYSKQCNESSSGDIEIFTCMVMINCNRSAQRQCSFTLIGDKLLLARELRFSLLVGKYAVYTVCSGNCVGRTATRQNTPL